MNIKYCVFSISLILVSIISLGLGHFENLLTHNAIPQYQESLQSIIDYRLPRLILGILVGIALGLAGTLIQTIIHNHLVSPDILGVSAGSGLAVVLILLYLPLAQAIDISIASVIGGLITGGLVIGLSNFQHICPRRLVLIGIAIASSLMAGVDILLAINPSHNQSAIIWLTGSLWAKGWQNIPLLLIALVVTIPIVAKMSWRLSIYGLGHNAASALGVSPIKTRNITMLMVIALTGISISICGIFSFIGLMAPNLSRLLFKRNHELFIPSALVGSLILILSDLLAQHAFSPLELPAGIITSIIGSLFFLLVLRKAGSLL